MHAGRAKQTDLFWIKASKRAVPQCETDLFQWSCKNFHPYPKYQVTSGDLGSGGPEATWWTAEWKQDRPHVKVFSISTAIVDSCASFETEKWKSWVILYMFLDFVDQGTCCSDASWEIPLRNILQNHRRNNQSDFHVCTESHQRQLATNSPLCRGCCVYTCGSSTFPKRLKSREVCSHSHRRENGAISPFV